MKIGLLNKIAKIGTDIFDKERYEVSSDLAGANAIMVRSAAMHDMKFDKELLAIARAGAGVNNIPVERGAKEGIVVFNPRVLMQTVLRSLRFALLCLLQETLSAVLRGQRAFWVRKTLPRQLRAANPSLQAARCLAKLLVL